MKAERTAPTAPRVAESKARWHRAQVSLPLREKVRILLQLQRQELPLLERLRPLRSWERPWPIDP